MFERIASLILICVLGLLLAGAVHDTPSLATYPVIVTATTLALTVLAVMPIALRPLPESPKSAESSSRLSISLLRTIAFCAVWISYAALLNTFGFILASSVAMIASLWIVLGRFRPLASAAAVTFVLTLAILVTTILFVPVPKGPIDHWIDEAIFSLKGHSK